MSNKGGRIDLCEKRCHLTCCYGNHVDCASTKYFFFFFPLFTHFLVHHPSPSCPNLETNLSQLYSDCSGDWHFTLDHERQHTIVRCRESSSSVDRQRNVDGIIASLVCINVNLYLCDCMTVSVYIWICQNVGVTLRASKFTSAPFERQLWSKTVLLEKVNKLWKTPTNCNS